MALRGQVHVVHGIELTAHFLGIQEVGTDEITLLLIIPGQLLRLDDAAGTHGGGHIAAEHALAIPMPMQAALA